jgi:hypothetical protein
MNDCTAIEYDSCHGEIQPAIFNRPQPFVFVPGKVHLYAQNVAQICPPDQKSSGGEFRPWTFQIHSHGIRLA